MEITERQKAEIERRLRAYRQIAGALVVCGHAKGHARAREMNRIIFAVSGSLESTTIIADRWAVECDSSELCSLLSQVELLGELSREEERVMTMSKPGKRRLFGLLATAATIGVVYVILKLVCGF